MMKKTVPETIDFSENTEEDQVITNMEELIKQQVAARQLDMENIQMNIQPKENDVEILKSRQIANPLLDQTSTHIFYFNELVHQIDSEL